MDNSFAILASMPSSMGLEDILKGHQELPDLQKQAVHPRQELEKQLLGGFSKEEEATLVAQGYHIIKIKPRKHPLAPPPPLPLYDAAPEKGKRARGCMAAFAAFIKALVKTVFNLK